MLVIGLEHPCRTCGSICMTHAHSWRKLHGHGQGQFQPSVSCQTVFAGFKELHDKFRGQPFEIVGKELWFMRHAL